jgi:hypothetical protein
VGVGVLDLFAYITVAQHIVTCWEWEEMQAEPPNGVMNSSMVGLDQAIHVQYLSVPTFSLPLRLPLSDP